ncbi:universal stress protein [Nesterenkonia aerolata]|uniref:Universal stress protein n=1 Tax=Nesterenkonia aerolata TaxID=3074079 RepID=A0ABU2DTT8_9MICC|nr:universal stress protein [Nesterenkonia sp. LY-0111]MDR8019800.1 universal stress protein [Nesterenkonia sp. LY-0111]
MTDSPQTDGAPEQTQESVEEEQPQSGFGVVVGIDGSEHSLGALRLAADEAGRRRLPLTMVIAYSLSPYSDSARAAGDYFADDSTLREGCKQVLIEAREHLGHFTGRLRGYVKYGDAADVLLKFSKRADLLVVGSRGRGGFAGRMLGSVSSGLPWKARCPVVIVPKRFTAQGAEGHRDVSAAHVSVGVDGSGHSLVAALEAAEEARTRQVPLRLVAAYTDQVEDTSWTPKKRQRKDQQDSVLARLDEDRTWLREQVPDVEIETVAAVGSPVKVMVEESRTAGLTVVGTRGRGGFAGMVLGSTSNGVMHYAEGPLMAVADVPDPRVRSHPRIARG